MHLFTEIFPLEAPVRPVAYVLRCPDDQRSRLGRALASRLRRAFEGDWLWMQGRILTDNERTAIELMITLDIIRGEDPGLFATLEALEADPNWNPSPQVIAEFALRTRLNKLEDDLNAALAQFNTTSAAVRIEREYKLAAWAAGEQPAISISVAARLVYEHDLQTFLASHTDSSLAVGLRVSDRTSTLTGEIVAVSGTVGERRHKMLHQARKETLARLIRQTPEEEIAVRVRTGDRRQEFPARALEILLRPADFARFNVDARQVNPALRPDPAARANVVRVLSDIAKTAGILGKGYNAREHPELFIVPHFEPYLRFNARRSRAYRPETLANDFIQCGAFHLRDKFREAPIQVCVVNALAMKLEDFVEALQRQLARKFEFSIEVTRERRVRVVSLHNIESAVRVVEKESPDLILAFIPDAYKDEDLPAFIKSLTLGRGIPAHVIFQSTLDDPDSMPGIIMAILAKTGNTPFALAEPLDFADYVAGLDTITMPAPNKADARLTAVVRIYRSDGEFVRYAVHTREQDGPPYVLLRDIFPQREFAGKRVVIHYDEQLPDELRQALLLWGQAIGAVFYTVEILRRGAPRLYAFDAKRVTAPPWGSAFRLNAHEGFLVLAADDDQPTPQPLHIIAHGITFEQAVQTIQLWTLLYYGAASAPKLPVTLHSAGELAYWLRKGGTFSTPESEVPFWL